jgi:hypothetical protein
MEPHGVALAGSVVVVESCFKFARAGGDSGDDISSELIGMRSGFGAT